MYTNVEKQKKAFFKFKMCTFTHKEKCLITWFVISSLDAIRRKEKRKHISRVQSIFTTFLNTCALCDFYLQLGLYFYIQFNWQA